MTQLESKSQKDDSMSSSGDLPQELRQSTNLNSRRGLIRRLARGRPARIKFVESHLNKKLAFQIRSLRGELSQEQMEAKVGIKQQALSRLENPYYGKATLTTLKKIAAGCDVGLLVEFVPFSQLINRVSGTPYTEYGFSPETMNVPEFEEEEKQGKFSEDNNEGVAAEAMLGKLKEMTVPAQNAAKGLLAEHLGGTAGEVSTAPLEKHKLGAIGLFLVGSTTERKNDREKVTSRRSQRRRDSWRNERRRIYG